MQRLRLILPLFLLAFSLAARAQVVGGTIAGLVTDSSGAAIPGAHVLIHNDDTGAQRSLNTNASGQYIASSIAVGPYTLNVTAPGFAQTTRTITLTTGQSLNLNLALSVAGHETVTVHDTQPIVNTSTEQTAGLVDSRQVKQLPLNGRSYDQLILLNPGTVNYTNQRSGGIGTSNSSVGSMFSVSGRRPQDNLFLLNGIEYTGASLINTTPGGTSGQLLGIDGIREFNVVTDTYSAAYGKRDGAQISIVTTGGTNQLHGSVYEFARNSFFDARNYFDGPRIPEFQRNNFGASLGGPIRKNKLFLFANYEGYRQNLGESLVTLVPDATSRAKAVASVEPLLNLWPIANGPEITQNGAATGIAQWIGSAPQHIREDFGTTRFDANLSNNDTFNSIYTIDDSDAVSPSANPYSYVDETLREQVLSAEEHHVFSPNFINVARFGFSRASYYFNGYVPAEQQALTPSVRPGVPTYAVVISGSTASNGASSITGAGANVGANNAITRNLFTFDDHVFYTVGKHTLEGGIWIQRLQSNDNLAQDQYGQASFASLATFLTGAIKTFTYAPDITELGWRTLFADAFLEDTWRITPRLQIRAGFRSESSTGWSESQNRASVYSFGAVSSGAPLGVISTNPTSGLSNALTDNRALFLPEPRIGLAWDAFGNGRTSVTASAGLHHSLLDALDYRLDQAAPYNTVNSYSSTTVTNPISGTPKISPSTIATNISTPTLFSYTLRIEQQLAPSTSLTLGYNGSHSYHQILNGDLNEPDFEVLANNLIYYPTTTKANNAVANTTSWWSGGTGNYNAFIVDLRHNLSRGLQFRINYTWSKNLDDGSAWNTSVSSNTPAFVSVPALPHLDYGPAATDVRHLFAANATYDLPIGTGQALFADANKFTEHVISGWSLASIVSLSTGFPFSPQLGYNPTGSGDSRNPVRPNVNPNFTGKLYPGGSTAQKAAQFFNPNAFSAPAYGTVGNAGRDSLVGPGYADWDFSLLKSTQITQRFRLQFRAEFFNILNHTNLSLPNEVVFSNGPTQGTTANQTTPAALGTPGVITATANTSRQIQLGLKLLF
ncbi:carboxypeptidase-like regulatory domain-containing protein [Granulicella sp. L46]|uniref:TonB-dependent receptor n=1 Tax=Granulicella sp. L46 TaxID=1641865 RepID=UPI00131D92B5|nr:carboxypeptidase-like regulatory domain-containing protein [Granulicella sp. L46]